MEFFCTIRSLKASAIAAAVASLAACGGGSGNSELPPAIQQDAVLTGTAATGGALVGGQVAVVAADGSQACRETGIVTGADGSYSCTLTTGKAAPFFVSVIDPSGTVPPLVSISTSTPAPGEYQVVNATPLTTAIVAQLSPDQNALTVVNNHAVDAAVLALTTNNVLAQLAPVLAAVGAPAGYSPFSSAITAASASGAGNAADHVLDTVKVSLGSDGKLALSTTDHPSPIPLASASTTTVVTVAAPTTNVANLSSAMQALSLSLNRCFALTPTQRVLTEDTTLPYAQGGAEATQLAPECQIADSTFLHNGFRFGQLFYSLLKSSYMTGATFSVPEVMLTNVAAHSGLALDTAVVNLRYVDNAGIAGNLITVAANKVAANAANVWTLYGNQQPVDIAIRPFFRRTEQRADVSVVPFTNATPSSYLTALEMVINKNGPGSTGLTAARVTGPGLPAPGILLNQPSVATQNQQSWLNVADKSGADPGVIAALRTGCACTTYNLQRTVGLQGTDATTLRPNPSAGSASNTNAGWAHPSDFGAAVGTPTEQYVPMSAFVKGAVYTVELFYNGSSEPSTTLHKTLLSAVQPATNGSLLAWNQAGPGVLASLDPSNATAAAATSAFLIDWVPNPSAEFIKNVLAFTWNSSQGGQVNNGLGALPARGATQATLPALNGTQFPALDNTSLSSRALQIYFRTFDGSQKSQNFRYN